MNDSFDSIPRSFARRAIAAVVLIFLLTMVVFLWAAYRSERSLHFEETFRHLEETSAVLSLLPELRDQPTAAGLAGLEERLAQRTDIPHRLVITESNFDIAASSEDPASGGDIRKTFSLVPYGSPDSGRAIGRDEDGRWLAASLALGDKKLFLMRSRSGSEGFVGRFWGIHGLHMAVTVILFVVLLGFLGRRYVRLPIEQLAAHIRRVESGEFESHPESYANDEFGWLAKRFTHMGLELKRVVARLVRTEKYAAASAVAYAVATEAMEPLNSLKRHVTYLQGLAKDDRDLSTVASSIDKDRRELVLAVVRLEKLGPAPEGVEVNSETDAASEVPYT
ncbi:MAG: HAMP domain-containing protein [Thermoanaerobaculia bacterium]